MQDRLIQIFQRQGELHNKFLPIHEARGLGLVSIAGKGPYDLTDQRFQFMIKTYAWYVIEEIAEVIEAQGTNHVFEELADVLHFFIELCIIVGITPEQLVGVETTDADIIDLLDLWWMKCHVAHVHDMHILVYHFIKHFGIAMECLKNKPWKQTMIEVDHTKFLTNIQEAGFVLVGMFKFNRLTADQMARAYFGKAAENSNRIDRGR